MAGYFLPKEKEITDLCTVYGAEVSLHQNQFLPLIALYMIP